MSGLTSGTVAFSTKCLMCIKAVVSPLYETLQQAVQDVAPVPHQLDVLRRAVHTLPVQNGTLKHVAEFLSRT